MSSFRMPSVQVSKASVKTLSFSTLSLSALFSAPSFAHVGHHHDSAMNAFFSGVTHPVTGLDHLVALVGFGLFVGFVQSKQPSKSIHLKLIMAALASLLIGLVSGRLMGEIASVETLIVGSLFVVAFGLWNVFSARETLTKCLTVASIALIFFHGFAHGVEASGSITQFSIGMLISAFILMQLGRKISLLLTHKWAAIGVASTSVAISLL